MFLLGRKSAPRRFYFHTTIFFRLIDMFRLTDNRVRLWYPHLIREPEVSFLEKNMLNIETPGYCIIDFVVFSVQADRSYMLIIHMSIRAWACVIFRESEFIVNLHFKIFHVHSKSIFILAYNLAYMFIYLIHVRHRL